MIKKFMKFINQVKSSIVSRYECHKKIMFLGSLYGVLLNKNEASLSELRGLLLSLNFNVSEGALRLPLAMQGRIWGQTHIRDYLSSQHGPTLSANRIYDTMPIKLRYGTKSEVINDITNVLNYVHS